MPEQPSRHFGAERKGVERTECGAGHCGVDLDGPRGRPVVAVADGTVVRVERHELGLDGKSGRYVRIEHDDGTLTAYMHLDEVADGLEVGDHVDGGQYIGILGATACYVAAAHLHFSLEIPNHPGLHGDNTDTHYVDPAPFLVRAKIVLDSGPQAPDQARAVDLLGSGAHAFARGLAAPPRPALRRCGRARAFLVVEVADRRLRRRSLARLGRGRRRAGRRRRVPRRRALARAAPADHGRRGRRARGAVARVGGARRARGRRSHR